ncbi:MMPL family transporter [Gordonia sp. NPDC003376]
MARHLYRIGKWAFRNRMKVIAAWILLLFGVGTAAALMSQPATTKFSIPGIASEQAQDLMVQRFPDRQKFNDETKIVYVLEAEDGGALTRPEYRQAIAVLVDGVRNLDGIDPTSVIDPVADYGTADAPGAVRAQVTGFHQQVLGQSGAEAVRDAQVTSPLNRDATTAQVEGTFTALGDDHALPDSDRINALAEQARAAGLTVAFTGSALPQPEITTLSEFLGLGAAAIVLVLTFGSLVAWGMPLVTALVGVGIGMMGIGVASYFFELNQETPILATMIGLAVGIDYALFIVSRYRHEARRTTDLAEAAGRAVGTAGSAVVFAGTTVFIALAALAIARVPFITSMGIAAALTVLVAVAVAVTLLPAVLGLLGPRAFAGRIGLLNPPDSGVDTKADHMRNGERWVRAVGRRPLAIAIGITATLLLLTIPAVGLTLALPTDATAAPSTTQRVAHDRIGAGFGDGYTAPLAMIVDGEGIASPTQRLDAFNQLTARVQALDGVSAAVIGADGLSQDGRTAIISVIPTGGATDDTTGDLVRQLRAMESGAAEQGLTYGVTGMTAIEIDISERLTDALVPYLVVVVGLALLLLMIVFRSVLVPITAALGFLLSVGATFGITVALYTSGAFGLVSNPQPLVSFFPIMLIGIVFGLAMDYQVFLVTRMREAYVHGADARAAVTAGFAQSSRVVVAAATIMIAVFAAFMLQELAFIQVMAFALAVAVFLDAFVIRMTLIPALLVLLGDKAWWLPGWLDRVLPRIDVEGEGLVVESAESIPNDPDDSAVGDPAAVPARRPACLMR